MRPNSRNLPSGWRFLKIGEIVDFSYGKGLPQNKRIEGNVPVVGSNGIIGYHNKALVKAPGIVVGRKGSIGEVIFLAKDFWPIDTTYFITLKKNERIDWKWLFYMLKKSNLKRFTLADVVPGLKREFALSLKIPLPPLPEQRKIAEILSTVDEAIEVTDKEIEKAERLKRGLMQELLTRGIGHTKFKKTEVGTIPEEWKLMKLGDCIGIRGSKKLSIKDKKIPFIPMELIPYNSVYVQYELREPEKIKSFTYCEAGDLLLAKITPSLENGKQGIVPQDIPNSFALATTEVFSLFPRKEKILNLFLFYLLKHPKFRNVLITSMIGTTGRQRASKEVLLSLFVPLPPLSEQKRIAEVLSSVDDFIESLRARREKLVKLKQGLMEDLLTGKRRVKVNAESSRSTSG